MLLHLPGAIELVEGAYDMQIPVEQQCLTMQFLVMMTPYGKRSNNVSNFLGGRLNIKMPSYQYWDPHVKDKTVSRPSYL